MNVVTGYCPHMLYTTSVGPTTDQHNHYCQACGAHWSTFPGRAAPTTLHIPQPNPDLSTPTDEEIIARCNAAGVRWIAPDDGDDEVGFPGGFDMSSMAEMRALLTSTPTSARGLDTPFAWMTRSEVEQFQCDPPDKGWWRYANLSPHNFDGDLVPIYLHATPVVAHGEAAFNALADDDADRAQYERDRKDPENCLGDAALASQPAEGQKELARLLAEHAEADVLRMDWIIDNCKTEGGGHGFTLTVFIPHDGECIRGSIDHAMMDGAAIAPDTGEGNQ